MSKVELVPLSEEDREQFITDNQRAFDYGALEEFGVRDTHFEEEGHVISRATIRASLDGSVAYRIMREGSVVGGLVLRFPDETHGDLDLLFVDPQQHSQGIGRAAWKAVEDLYPRVTVWETVTPYFEKRNIHFYLNVLGFHAVEFFEDNGEMFRFMKEKV